MPMPPNPTMTADDPADLDGTPEHLEEPQSLADFHPDEVASYERFLKWIELSGQGGAPAEDEPPMAEEEAPERLGCGAPPSPTNARRLERMDDEEMPMEETPMRNRRGGPPARPAPAAPTTTARPDGNGHGAAELVRLRRQNEAQTRRIEELERRQTVADQQAVYLDRFGKIHQLVREIHGGDEAAAAKEVDAILAKTAGWSEEAFADKVEDLTRLARALARPSRDRVPTDHTKYTDPTAPLPDDPKITAKLQRFGKKWQEENGIDIHRNERAAGRMLLEFKAALARGEV